MRHPIHLAARTRRKAKAALLAASMSCIIALPQAFAQQAPPQTAPPRGNPPPSTGAGPQDRHPVRPPSQSRPGPHGAEYQRPNPPQRPAAEPRADTSGNGSRSASGGSEARSRRGGNDAGTGRESRRERGDSENVVWRWFFSGANHSERKELRRREGEERLVRPRRLPRLKALPEVNNHRANSYWDLRFWSICDSLAYSSRAGFIPVTEIPADVSELTDYSETPAGWRGYALVVPPGETVTFSLSHTYKPWFRLRLCDKWGQPLPGGLESMLPQFEPKLTYTNVRNTEQVAYLLVDDPGWVSNDRAPYTLKLAKSWNPSLLPVKQRTIAIGIWGSERSVSARFKWPRLVMPGFI